MSRNSRLLKELYFIYEQQIQNFKMQNKRRRNKVSKFIPNLHKILQDENSGAVWRKDGKSFVINDFQKLISNSIAKYFRHSNISSFIRQLNLYGFKKILGENVQQNSYFHENFKRGCINQLKPLRSFYNRQNYSESKKIEKANIKKDKINVLDIQTNQQNQNLLKNTTLQISSTEIYYKEKAIKLQEQNQRLRVIEQNYFELLSYLHTISTSANDKNFSEHVSINNSFQDLCGVKTIEMWNFQMVKSYFQRQDYVQKMKQICLMGQGTYFTF